MKWLCFTTALFLFTIFILDSFNKFWHQKPVFIGTLAIGFILIFIVIFYELKGLK